MKPRVIHVSFIIAALGVARGAIVCDPGYEDVSTPSACTMCPEGKSKAVYDNSTCIDCPPGLNSHPGEMTCKARYPAYIMLLDSKRWNAPQEKALKSINLDTKEVKTIYNTTYDDYYRYDDNVVVSDDLCLIMDSSSRNPYASIKLINVCTNTIRRVGSSTMEFENDTTPNFYNIQQIKFSQTLNRLAILNNFYSPTKKFSVNSLRIMDTITTTVKTIVTTKFSEPPNNIVHPLDGTAPNIEFGQIMSTAISADGNTWYVANQDRIRAVSLDTATATSWVVAGSTAAVVSNSVAFGDPKDGVGINAKFRYISKISTYSDGKSLFALDVYTPNSLLRKLNTVTNMVVTLTTIASSFPFPYHITYNENYIYMWQDVDQKQIVTYSSTVGTKIYGQSNPGNDQLAFKFSLGSDSYDATFFSGPIPIQLLYRCNLKGYSTSVTAGTQVACIQCPIGTYGPGNGTCITCPPYLSTELPGARNSSMCVYICPIGSYCTGTPPTHTTLPCAPPPNERYVYAGPGTSYLTCPYKCANGFYGPACDDCPPQSYCYDSLKYACPAGTVSQGNSTSFIDCTCPTGTYGTVSGSAGTVNSYCTACDAGKYNPMSGAKAGSQCLSCPEGTWAPVNGSTKCIAGCPPGFYCPAPIFAPIPCAPLPNDKAFHTGPGNSYSTCPYACVKGFYGANCSACPTKSFCYNSTRTPCPIGTTSPENSTTYLHCVCTPGTYGTVASATSATCVPCPKDAFCTSTPATCGACK